jgi:mono/diheme cytochrome c family protein
VQPFELAPRVMPPGTLPVHGGESRLPREEASRVLADPLPATPDHLAHGKQLFEIHCAVCHGASGQGDGPVSSQTIIPAADLTAGQPTERSDGYIYATIRNGSIIMPAYGDAMSAVERWELVLWVRSLQKQVAGR